jgi:hypothetical protein
MHNPKKQAQHQLAVSNPPDPSRLARRRRKVTERERRRPVVALCRDYEKDKKKGIKKKGVWPEE